MTHLQRLLDYFEAIDQLLPQLPEDERQAYHEWRPLPGSLRDSDWPGWVKYLGPRPTPQKLRVLRMRRSA